MQEVISRALASLMGNANCGVVLLDSEGSVRWRNTLADSLLAANDGMCVRSGRLALWHRTTAPEFRRTLGELANHHDAQGRLQVQCSALTVPRPSGDPPYFLVLLRLDGQLLHDGNEPAFVAGIITDPAHPNCPPEDLLRKAFSLTEREGALAALLASRVGVTDAAGTLGVSLATVRSMLKILFQKTGTHRQGELVASLWRAVPVLVGHEVGRPKRGPARRCSSPD